MATVKALTIKARGKKFRRCGYQFGDDAVVLPVSDLTKEQLEQLREEKQLVVVDSEMEEEKSGKKKPA